MEEIRSMKDQDYIKAGVELADGWVAYDSSFLGGCYFATHSYSQVPQPVRAALAAQLTEQVDATDDYGVYAEPTCTYVWEEDKDDAHQWNHEGPNRSMNTIKAVVDSKVLK